MMARRSCAAALIVLLALCRIVSLPSPLRAGEPLIYWPQAGPLLVLADTEVVVEARYAPVFYWPITREYLADFSQDLRLAEGRVEIVDRSGQVTVVEPESYLLWYPAGVGAGPSTLVRGGEAEALYGDYLEAARIAAKAAQQYQRIVAESQAAVEAWLRMAAERRKDLPRPPPELTLQEPEPFQAFATEPRQAAVISLPKGTYTVRLRDAGNRIVPQSERELVSFGATDKAMGYVLRPEERWTRPVFSFAPDAAIYTTGSSDLFFQPVPVLEYEARRFTRLFHPQSFEAADPSLTVWVPQQEEPKLPPDLALALWDGATLVASLPRKPYRVSQLPGVSRGYVIEEFAPRQGVPLQPDFYAMRMGLAAPFTHIGLLDGAGKPVGASERLVRRVDPMGEGWLFLPALLPLALGVALRLRGRRHAPAGPAAPPAGA
jgi:hypothetical protein